MPVYNHYSAHSVGYVEMKFHPVSTIHPPSPENIRKDGERLANQLTKAIPESSYTAIRDKLVYDLVSQLGDAGAHEFASDLLDAYTHAKELME